MPVLRHGLLALLVALLLAAGTSRPCRAALTREDLTIPKLQALLRDDPSNLKVRYLLGRLLSRAGRSAEAVQHYQAILQARPVPAVMFHLGVELAKLGDLQQAIFQWDEIVKKYRPNNLTTLGYLGLALHKLAQSQDTANRRFELHRSSLEYFKRILRIDPGNLKARLYAGSEYAKLGQTVPAVKQWILAVRAHPKDIQAWVLLTKGLYRLQKLDKVRLAVGKILQLDPSNVFARELQSKLDRLPPDELTRDASSEVETGVPDPQSDGPDVVDREPAEVPPEEEGEDRPIPRLDDDPLANPPPLDSPMNLQAEQLFLDGLDFKERGNYEKALYAFLKATDIDPKFSQVYLQIGEVYLALAKLAPTKNQFEERIQLSTQALSKVNEYTPGSLLAHASRAKIALVERLRSQGFTEFHLEMAASAVEQDRAEDAFEEFVLLLSNAVFKPEIFYELGRIMPKLTGGNLQDLQFFLEELYGQHQESYLAEYLLAKTYYRLGKVNEASAFLSKFVDHTEILAPHVTQFIDRTAGKDSDQVDLFCSAKLLVKRQDRKEALKRLDRYLKSAQQNDAFYQEALKLRSTLGTIVEAGQSMGFEDEKKELLSQIARIEPIFGVHFKPAMIDEKLLQDLKVFLANYPENMLARFLFGWANQVAAGEAGLMQKDMEKLAEETFNELLGQKTGNPAWHLELGIHAIRWSLVDHARAHLKVAGDLLLLKGHARSTEMANRALREASDLIDQDKLEAAGVLLRQSRELDRLSLNYHLVQARYLLAKNRSADAVYALMEMVQAALSDPWFRLVIFTDLGLLLFRAVSLSILLLSALLVVRYFEELRHLLLELWQQKGLLLPFSLAISIFLVLVFPTGLVVFLPLLTWSMLRKDEKTAFLLLLGLLVVIPVLLPVSLSDNFELLHRADGVRTGRLEGTREFFEEFLKSHPGDFNATYLLGMSALLEGTESGYALAEKVFSQLSNQYAEEPGPYVNLGNLQVRKGDTASALEFYNKALGKNPANTEALYNISQIYSRAGQMENKDKYLRWARRVSREHQQLGRFEAASLPPTTFLLTNYDLEEERLREYFTLAGTFGLVSLSGPLVFFACWFLFGGGLVGFLIFTRERLDVVMRRCYHCLKIVCNGCQKVQEQKAFCVGCADPEARKQVNPKERHRQLREVAFKKGAAFNLIFPGGGLVFTGHTLLGLAASLVFFTLALAGASGGGWLANFLYEPVHPAPLNAIRIAVTLAALALYTLLQAIFFKLREQVV